MKHIFSRRFCVMAALVMASPLCVAHGSTQGDLVIDHPYALPSAQGESHGRAHLRGIQNKGDQADRLVSASTPVAALVKLHSLRPDANGLRGMEVPVIELPAKTTVKLRHTGDYQITLVDLKALLKDGDRFDLTLNFAHAGSQTVKVWVQTPREAPSVHLSH
ncbi:MAG: copper chaperone PCu(A)C [Rhodoferax sp.]|nr:copper chaperone PCu(A)C [Rhodoferax sp.]